MKTLHCQTPIITNAHHNRKMATKAYRAGLTPQQIADEWPQVFYCEDGKLGQIYDSVYKDSNLKETRYMITESSVNKAIKSK